MSNNQGTPEFTIEGLLDDLNLALDENKELCAEVERLEKERDIYKEALVAVMCTGPRVPMEKVIDALDKGEQIAEMK